MSLRVSLWKAGFMGQLPNLLKQQTNGMQCYIRILLQMYDREGGAGGSETERLLLSALDAIIQHFVTQALGQSSSNNGTGSSNNSKLRMTAVSWGPSCPSLDACNQPRGRTTPTIGGRPSQCADPRSRKIRRTERSEV